MGKRIVWFSGNAPPVVSQLKDLKYIFPDCHVIPQHSTWHGVDEIIDIYQDLGGDEMVTLIPLSMIRELINRGYQPIRPITRIAKDDETPEIIIESKDGRKKHQMHVKFVRVLQIKQVEKDLKPEDVRQA